MVILSVGTIFIGGLFPAVQQNREAARLIACGNRLRQMGKAVYQYSDAHERLPLAALSYKGTQKKEQWDDEKDPAFWQAHQWTSTAALIAKYMDLEELIQRAAPFNYDVEATCFDHPEYKTFFKIKGFFDLVYSRPSKFLCPSDREDVATRQVITILPTYEQDLSDASDDSPWYTYWAGWEDQDGYSSTAIPGRSNYMACAGVNFGGVNRPGKSAAFRGMLGLREKTRLETINSLDGTSNTVMLGESMGEINMQRYLPSKHPKYDPDGDKIVRRLTQTWNQGCFVRGRGDVDWGAEPAIGQTGDPDDLMLGDARFADIKGFSSFHPKGIVVVMGDGATRVVPRSINWKTWYALCGSRDGKEFDIDDIPLVRRKESKQGDKQ